MITRGSALVADKLLKEKILKMKNKEFSPTPEGCERAKEYLKSINRFDQLPTHERDGFSIVYIANKIYKRNNESSET